MLTLYMTREAVLKLFSPEKLFSRENVLVAGEDASILKRKKCRNKETHLLVYSIGEALAELSFLRVYSTDVASPEVMSPSSPRAKRSMSTLFPGASASV